MNQWKPEANTRNRRQARENSCEQVAIGFGFASDWLTRWREFSKPITECSKAKPKQISDTNLKTALTKSDVPDTKGAVIGQLCRPYSEDASFLILLRADDLLCDKPKCYIASLHPGVNEYRWLSGKPDKNVGG